VKALSELLEIFVGLEGKNNNETTLQVEVKNQLKLIEYNNNNNNNHNNNIRVVHHNKNVAHLFQLNTIKKTFP